MAQNALEGEFSISADGAHFIANQPFPVCGTITLSVVQTGWTGTIYPRLIGRADPLGTAGTACVYQSAATTTDVDAGDTLVAGKFYIRLDGTRLELYVTGYSGGTTSGTWSWSQG